MSDRCLIHDPNHGPGSDWCPNCGEYAAIEVQVHPVCPDGPPCNPHCPGTWSQYHDGYRDGYCAAEERIKAGVLALGSVTGIVKASGDWDAFVVRSAVLKLLGPGDG